MRRLWIATIVAVAALAAPTSGLAGTITGTVTDSSGAAEEDARVVVIDKGADNALGGGDDRTIGSGDTAANGTFSIVVPTGGGTPTADGETVVVVTHDAGSAPTQTNVTLSGGAGATGTIIAQVSGTTFAALGIYGGQINRIIAGGAPCEFYAKTSVIPQIFGTSDCGGTWTAATTQTDSSALGLSGSTAIDSQNFTTSGVPGEVAAIVNGTIQFSRDYGVTWTRVGGVTLSGPGQSKYLYWGHVVGGRDVLLVREDGNTYTANLAVASPTLAATTGYVAAATDGIVVGNGATNPYLAVATAFSTGATTIKVFPLQAGGTAPAADTTLTNQAITGATNGATPVLGFGGTTATGAPDVLFVGDLQAGSADPMQVFVDTADGATFAAGATPNVISECGAPQAGAVAEATVARLTDPGSVAGMIAFGKCAITLPSNAATITPNAGTQTNFAVDPSWGTNVYVGSGSVSAVLIAPQGDRGIQKSASATGGVPDWPVAVSTVGAAGIGSGTGGIVVNGLSVPVVRDVRFGPGGASDVGVIFSVSGGGLCLASSDGLATAANTKAVVDHGGRAMDWWQGAGATDDWILCDHGDGTIAGRKDWTPASPTVSSTIDVIGGSNNFTSAQHGVDAFYAISGIPGADAAFLGGHVAGAGAGSGKVLRVGLSVSGPGAVQFAAGYASFTLSEPISRMAYCPAGSAAGFADVLFIGTGVRNAGGGSGGATGKVYRLAGASSATSGTAPTLMTGSGTTSVGGLDVNCTTGALYAGFQSGGAGTDPAIQLSTNGTSLTTVKTHGDIGPGISNVTALAVNPSGSSELIFATASEGKVWASLDGGTTLTVANNPQVFPGGVNFNSEGIWALRIPPGLVRSKRSGGFHNAVGVLAAISNSSTAVGTGGGAYRASFRSSLTAPAASGSSGGGASSGSGASATPKPTLRISAPKWDKAKRTIAASVTASKAGKVTLTVSSKVKGKLKVVATSSATVKAGANAVKFKVATKLRPGTYTLVVSGSGATGTSSLKVR